MDLKGSLSLAHGRKQVPLQLLLGYRDQSLNTSKLVLGVLCGHKDERPSPYSLPLVRTLSYLLLNVGTLLRFRKQNYYQDNIYVYLPVSSPFTHCFPPRELRC
jgi:hypothetical protein